MYFIPFYFPGFKGVAEPEYLVSIFLIAGVIGTLSLIHIFIGEGGLKVVQPVPTVDSRDKPAPKPQDSQGSRKEIVNPVEGGVIVKGFSGNELVYNATLDQYMVHQGVDIEARCV